MTQPDKIELTDPEFKPMPDTIRPGILSRANKITAQLELGAPIGRRIIYEMKIVGGTRETIIGRWRNTREQAFKVTGRRPHGRISVRLGEDPGHEKLKEQSGPPSLLD